MGAGAGAMPAWHTCLSQCAARAGSTRQAGGGRGLTLQEAPAEVQADLAAGQAGVAACTRAASAQLRGVWALPRSLGAVACTSTSSSAPE